MLTTTFLIRFYNVGTKAIREIAVGALNREEAERIASSKIHLTAGQWVILQDR